MTSLQTLFENEQDEHQLIEALSNHGVATDRDLLLADLTTLSKRPGIIKENLETLLETLVHRSYALPIRGDRDALDESSRAKHWMIPSGSSVLDAALSGGLQPGLVSEIAGGARSGKSTIAYHLLATHILTHLTSSVAYIDTQGTLDPARLANIIQHRLHAHQLQLEHPNPNLTMDGLLDRVKIMRAFDILGILSAIEEIRSSNTSSPQDAAETKVVDFLIIDTISTPLSLALTKSQAAGHAHMLTLARALRTLCTTQQVVALLLNSTVMNMDGGSSTVGAFGVGVKPALGGTWGYCVDDCWMLSTQPMKEEDGREWRVIECLRSKRGGEGRWGAIRFEGTDIIGIRSDTRKA